MEQDHSSWYQIFDPFPEPVYLLQGVHILYTNPAGRAQFGEQEAPHKIFEALPEGSVSTYCTLDTGVFHVTSSLLPEGRLVMLRPVASSREPQAQYGGLPAQLREQLTSLAATAEQLGRQLGEVQNAEAYQHLLSVQNRAIHRILRLSRQMELSQDNWSLAYPMGTADLAGICHATTQELSSYLDGESPTFQLACAMSSLHLTGNEMLLEQLVLSLASNGLKSAGPRGSVELNLAQYKGNAVLSVWDSGSGIPEDRLLHLFSQRPPSTLPRPGEGAGLDLWIAHRIAAFHDGVIMAGNRPGGGAEFTISIPIKPPQSLRFRSADNALLGGEGFSSVLVGLSDALPLGAFRPAAEP